MGGRLSSGGEKGYNLPQYHSPWYIISNSAKGASISARMNWRYKSHQMSGKHLGFVRRAHSYIQMINTN